ncbi:conserved hypothetical protein [Anaeromyxobacter sp. K]|uniref:hypothetical protein n=1 Tax=Anaeromyxobacter sp. (strain K) TaxID=447217 RepID=UPI00017BE41E|nr:hypothetical protein [Anaeromyxobacter sp. K]ACG74764.1 conserved hypothetical protein [Anaeromyxobacter sp. K]
MHARILCHAAALLVAGAAAAADAPPAGGLPDVAGPRTLGLSASIGVAANNEGLSVNPAAVGARRRYALEVGGMLDRRGAESPGQFLNASVVDAMSSSVTAGFAFTRAAKGDAVGNQLTLALVTPLVERMWIGAAGKWLDLRGPLALGREEIRAATVDAGLFWQVSDLFSLGAAGYNLVAIHQDQIAPMGFGAGMALGNDQGAQLTADWRSDLDRLGKTSNRYSVGAEVLAGRMVALRAGFMKDETLDTNWWSAGLGIAAQSGAAVDVGYRQSTSDPSARQIAASLKIYMFN